MASYEEWVDGDYIIRDFGNGRIVRIYNGDQTPDLPTVEVNLSKDTAIADGEDSVEISFVLKNDDGSTYDWSGEYKIILRNEDNSVIKPLLININNGEGQFTVKSSTPRRIKILPQDIRTAVLPSEIIVDFVEPVTSSEVIL